MNATIHLPRPLAAPHGIPRWAWDRHAWLLTGKHGPRPGPHHTPAWFHAWHHWRLALAEGKGSKAWKRYLAETRLTQAEQDRAAVVHWARWGVAHSALFGYSEGADRGEWLKLGIRPPHLPENTDCSGFGTECYWLSRLPDPNGLDYRYLGYTGTILENAAQHGRIFSDVSKAMPGDHIVIGPGSGWHEVLVLEAGTDPLVATHGAPGVVAQRLSVDGRVPKRVCQFLPVS